MAARNCRISFVLSVLPAPDSPLQRVGVAGQASVPAVPLADVSLQADGLALREHRAPPHPTRTGPKHDPWELLN